MINVRRVSEIIESIVRIPSYTIMGVAGDRIVYTSTAEGAVGLWSMNMKGGDRRLIASEIHDVARPLRESRFVVYTRDVARGRELHKIYYVDSRGGGEKLLADTPLMRIFTIVFDGKKAVFAGATTEDIAIYMAKPDGSWEKLYKLGNIAFVTDANDRYAVGFGSLRGDPRTTELFIYDFGRNEFKVYTPKEGTQNKYPILSGDRVLFESNIEGRNRLYIYDIGSGELTRVRFSSSDYESYNPVEHSGYGWAPDGRIWAIGKRDGRTRLFIDGREVKTPSGTIHGFPAFVKDKVFVAVSSMLSPPRIYEVSIKKNKARAVVDNSVPKEVGKAFGDIMFVRYKSFDGLEIPMYIATSRIAGRPGPAVVYVHGGPWAEVQDIWSISIASLVALGVHVLAPNFRGSTGYGDEFRLMDIGDPGGGDLEDVVHAAKWAIEKGLADKERVAIMGYSYGGYMTYLAMGRYPDIWRCGVAGAGVVDWEEMYSLSDASFRQFIDILFAGKKELWRERSPITYVEKVSKPLCIIHPQNDTRTPLKPVLKYMSKLLELGKTFEAHIAPDMGHAITRLEDAVKILFPALLFLDKNLKSSSS